MVTPVLAFWTDPSISAAVVLAASADRIARFRTSSATTANPLPASPARAASTAALRARRFVWNAISSIVLMILAVLTALFWMSAMAAFILPIAALPLSAAVLASDDTAAACWVVSAFFLVIELISSRALL